MSQPEKKVATIDKRFHINPELRKEITAVFNNNPNLDADKVTDIIVSSKKLRLNAEVVKRGV